MGEKYDYGKALHKIICLVQRQINMKITAGQTVIVPGYKYEYNSWANCNVPGYKYEYNSWANCNVPGYKYEHNSWANCNWTRETSLMEGCIVL